MLCDKFTTQVNSMREKNKQYSHKKANGQVRITLKKDFGISTQTSIAAQHSMGTIFQKIWIVRANAIQSENFWLSTDVLCRMQNRL